MHCSEVDETATGSANFWSRDAHPVARRLLHALTLAPERHPKGVGVTIQRMSEVKQPRRGRAPLLLATGGVACALAVLPLALFAPVYSGESSSSAGTVATTSTLVDVNGLWIIWLLCIPVFLALTAWAGLHFRCARGSGWGTRVAWLSVVLLWVFAVIGSASVGFFLIPTALLLVVAARHTPTPTEPRSAS